MAFNIAQVDLPGIWQAGAALEANNQRSRLLDLQQAAAQEKLGIEKQQRARLASFIGTLPQDQQAMFGAFPEEFGAALAKSRFPDPDKPVWSMNDGMLYNQRTGEVRPGGGGLTLEGGGTIGGPVAPMGGPAGIAAPGAGTSANLPPLGALPEQYRPLVAQHAQRVGLPADVLERWIMAESSGDPNAVSPTGATGLTQIIGSTGRQPGFGVTPMQGNSEAEQVRFGADYLKAMVDRYGGDLRLGLAAYNAGPKPVDDWLAMGGDINNADPKVVAYVNRIMGGGAGQPAAANAPRPITPGGQQAAGSAALGGGVTPPVTSPSGQAAPPGAVPSAPPANIPAGATATAPDANGLRRVLDKGKPYTTGAPPGHQWAVDRNRQWHAVPIRGGPDAAGGFGSSAEGRAVQALVDEGVLTRAQGAAWLAGKTVTGPNGQADFLTPGQGLTQIRPGQMSAQEREAVTESDNSVATLEGALGGLRQAAALNEEAFEGFTAGGRAWLDAQLPGDFGGNATQEFDTLIKTQGLALLKPTFGGNPTEGERKAAEQLMASIDKPVEVRKRLLDTAIKAAEGRLAREKARAQALRAGTYYTQGAQAPQPPADPGAYAGMDKDQLMGIDPAGLSREQKAAYLAALRGAK